MRKIGLLILILSLSLSCKEDKTEQSSIKTIGALAISTDKPQPGDTIEISYKKDSITDAFFYYLVSTKGYPADIDLEALNNEQKASIKIPDSANAIAFIFKVEDDYDSNDKKGYLIPLYNENAEQIPGSESAMAFYSIRNGSYYGLEAKNSDVKNTIKKDIETYPELKKNWEKPYIMTAYENDKTEGETLVKEYLEALNNKDVKSEEEYNTMITFYNIIQQQEKSDSIKAVVIEKFPNGQQSIIKSYQDFNKEKDLAKKEEIFLDYKSQHSKMDDYGNSMANALAGSFLEDGNFKNFEKYSSMVEDKNRKASNLNNIAWELATEGKNLEEAEKISKTSLDLITDLQKNPVGKPDYATQRNYEEGLKSSYSMCADTYALILFKQGKAKEAIKYQELAHDPKARDAEANARFISYLIADEQYNSVLEKASKFIKLGNGNDETIEAYKTAYNKVNPKAKDVEDKIAELQKTGHEANVSKIKSGLLDEKAPNFSLKDTKGNTITLSDLKGKIVILDFWATWCGPCKASFPGMQQVVKKYEDDSDIVFLFIDTFERGKNRELTVEDFITKNNYDFHVLYDDEIKKSRDFEVAKKYDIKGIPTKVIIGLDGNIQYKPVGYTGSTDKLVSEMEIIIDLLKSMNKLDIKV